MTSVPSPRAVEMRWSCLTVVLTWIGALASLAIAESSGPADDLFRLVPVDSGVTLAVEDLRGHSKEIRESALFEGLSKLEAVRAWLGSERFRMIERTSKEIQEGFGISLEVIRDDLLGDAVILALQPGPANQPDLAQGLLLVRPRDKPLMARLLKTLNQIQTRSGELDRVEPRTRGASTYHARLFKAGGRPPEFTILLDDGTLAWSNSEAMILGVIDRKGGSGLGLGDDPNFRKVREGLPRRALLSLFVNPRLVERLMTGASPSPKPSEDWLASLLGRYLSAVSQVGFAVEWREGLSIHSHEVLIPEKLDPWLRRWLTRPPSTALAMSESVARIPNSAVALASIHVDFEALAEASRDLIPESARPSFANLKLAAQGILLGHDPTTWVFPRLHQGVMVYLDVEPESAIGPSFPWVAVVAWSKGEGLDELAGPFDNAIRTLFAMVAVDPKYRDASLRIEDRARGDARVTSLVKGAQSIMAYRTDRDRLVVGNSSEAVARLAIGPSNVSLAEIRSKYVAESETFAVVDVRRLAKEVSRLREPIARKLAARSHRPVDATKHDLAQLIDVATLFRAFTFSIITSKDASEIHRTIRLIAR